MESKIAEDRGVDASTAGSIQSILTQGAVGVGGTSAVLRTSGIASIGCSHRAVVETVLHHRSAGVSIVVDVRRDSRRWIWTVIGDAVLVGISSRGDVEWVAALDPD